jgi:hypothetical protein
LASTIPSLSIGNLTLPSAGYTSSSGEHLFEIVDTAVLSPTVVNETHFQFARDSTSQSTSPGLKCRDSFVSGGSGYSAAGYADSYDIENEYELQNYTSVTKERKPSNSGCALEPIG